MQAHGLQAADGACCIGLDGIGNHQPPGVAAVDGCKYFCAAMACISGNGNAVFLHQLAVAAEDAPAFQYGFNAVTADLFHGCRAVQAKAPVLRSSGDAVGDGVGGMLLAACADAQQFFCAEIACGLNGLQGKIALRDGAGLIHDHSPDPAQGFNGQAALKQYALAGACADAGEKGQRHAQYQRAGTAHDQKGQRRIDPVIPIPRNEGGNDGCAQRNEHYTGGINAGKAGDEALHLRLAGGGILHAVQDAADHGFAQGFFRQQQELSAGIHAAGEHFVSAFHAYRHRLAGDGGGIYAALAIDDRAVQRNAVAGADQQHIAGPCIRSGDFLNCIACNAIDGLGAQVDGLHDFAAALLHGPMLKIFADAVKQHHAHGLCKFSDGECAQRGNGHQEVFIKEPAAAHAARSFQQNFAAKQQIGKDADRQHRQHARTHALHRYACDEEQRADDEQDQFAALLCIVGRAVRRFFCGGNKHPHLRFNARADCADLGKKGVGMPGLYAQLLRCKSNAGFCHAVEGGDLRLHLCGAVGAAQVFQNIYPLLHAVQLRTGRVFSMMMRMSAGAAAVMAVMRMPAGAGFMGVGIADLHDAASYE